MSIPNEALQKLVQEIEAQAAVAQQQINVVRTQISAKQRDIRLLELTSKEVGSLPRETNIYEGVGKIPRDDTEKKLGKETAELKAEVQNLGKKLHYLETTHRNSREHIEQIFKGGGRG